VKNYPEELAEVQEEYAQYKATTTEKVEELETRIRELEKQQADTVDPKGKVGVRLTNGVAIFYNADRYKVLPNSREPQLVEFRRTINKALGTYLTVATVKWSEVATLHEPGSSVR
jgi:hypothetical protein